MIAHVSLLPQLGPSTRTRPIRDSQGRTVLGGVARLEPLTLGGVRQWLLVRGRRAESPILLKLHGGPGQAEMATAGLNGLLENDFVVVEWDQRGSGKSRAAIKPAAAMNASQLVADTIELAEHLYQRRNFGADKTIPLVDRDWRKCLNLVTGVFADIDTGDVAALRHLTDDHLRFLERFAAYAQERCGVGPVSGSDDPLAAEARRVAGRSRALVAARRDGGQGIVQRLLARTTAWCRSVR